MVNPLYNDHQYINDIYNKMTKIYILRNNFNINMLLKDIYSFQQEQNVNLGTHEHH